MITRCGLLLLIALFVFLVNDDEGEVGERKKYAGTSPKYELIWKIGHLSLVNIKTLHISKPRMIHTHLVAEETAEAFCHLRSKSYLWQEVENLSSLTDILVYQMYVYLRLAR